MAKKVLKTRTQITSTLRNDLYKKLQKITNETDVPISRLLDRALEKYFKESEFLFYFEDKENK